MSNIDGNRVLIESLEKQWEDGLKLLRKTITCFDPEQWVAGISQFEVPWKVAYHILQCLAYYFRDDPGTSYRDIPNRYVKDWWEIPENESLNQQQLLVFLDEVAEQIRTYLAGHTDKSLGEPFPGFASVMENVEYAQRHTMHHQGGLNVLAVYHKIDIDLWDPDG